MASRLRLCEAAAPAFAAVLWLGGLGACAPAAATPRETLTSLRRAYAAGDAEAVWALLSPEARAQTSREELARILARTSAGTSGRTSGVAAEPDAKEFDDVWAAAVIAPVRAELGAGSHELTLVWLDSERRWALQSPPPGIFDLSSPRRALGTFVRAVEHRRWGELLALAPAARRRHLTPESLARFWTGAESEPLRRLLPALRIALGAKAANPVVELGPEAHFPFAAHAEAFLVKEDGLWRVEEIEAPEIPRD